MNDAVYNNAILPTTSQNPSFTTSTSHNKLVVGTNADNFSLQVAKQLKWFFMSRVDSKSDVQCVSNYLETNLNITDAVVSKMGSRNGYSSFKFGVSEEFVSKMLLESSWPRGLLVKEFEIKSRHNKRSPSNNGNFFHSRGLSTRQT